MKNKILLFLIIIFSFSLAAYRLPPYSNYNAKLQKHLQYTKYYIKYFPLQLFNLFSTAQWKCFIVKDNRGRRITASTSQLNAKQSY